MEHAIDRDALRRVIAVINGKGGVGKTTVTANVAGLLARSEFRVLVVDLDPQGNLGLDLGYADTDNDDQGSALAASLLFGAPATVTRDVRPSLDVLVGGPALHDAQSALAARNPKSGDPRAALARTLTAIAGEYDVILIDCPPGSDALQQTAVGAAKWALIPSKADAGSERGLHEVARRFETVADINPELDLLGVVLFDMDTTATRVTANARAMIAGALGTDARTFAATIRHSASVGQQGRAHRMLVDELDAAARVAPPWWKVRRGEADPASPLSRTATSVADDFHALVLEIVARLEQDEIERNGALA